MGKANTKGFLSSFEAIMEKHKSYAVAISLQAAYAGMFLFSKAAIAKGMNPFVFVLYRQVFATFSLAPIAFVCERKNAASPSLILLGKMFLISLFGLTACLILNYSALDYTTATFATAMNNTIPVFTFVVAVCLRMESIFIKQRHGKAKVLGVLLCLTGAAVYSFVKGPLIYGRETSKSPTGSTSKGHWIIGPLLTFFANAAWSLWIVLQKPILKEYPSRLSFMTIECFFSSIFSAIVAVSVESNISAYKLRWDISLISLIYCGVIVTGLIYSLQAWLIEKKGPVFVAQFTPLSLIFAAIVSAIVFKEIFHLGSVCGAILLVMGLYSFLWGKSRETNDETMLVTDQQNSEARETSTIECITQKC